MPQLLAAKILLPVALASLVAAGPWLGIGKIISREIGRRAAWRIYHIDQRQRPPKDPSRQRMIRHPVSGLELPEWVYRRWFGEPPKRK